MPAEFRTRAGAYECEARQTDSELMKELLMKLAGAYRDLAEHATLSHHGDGDRDDLR